MNKTIIVTGATGAIGGAAVRMLRERGCRVIGTSRRPLSADDSGECRSLDIASPDSIRAFVSALQRDGIGIDGLLNNAGTMLRTFETTAEGFERVTATNYLGTSLLTRQLLPLMNPGATVVATVSLTCYTAHFDKDFFHVGPERYSQLGTYGNSKMAVMLFAEELHRRHGDRVRVYVTDPGVVNSRMLHMSRWYDPLADLVFRPFTKSPEGGATPAVNAVTFNPADAAEARQLLLFRGRRHHRIPQSWLRPDMARWLWDETERLLPAE